MVEDKPADGLRASDAVCPQCNSRIAITYGDELDIHLEAHAALHVRSLEKQRQAWREKMW